MKAEIAVMTAEHIDEEGNAERRRDIEKRRGSCGISLQRLYMVLEEMHWIRRHL